MSRRAAAALTMLSLGGCSLVLGIDSPTLVIGDAGGDATIVVADAGLSVTAHAEIAQLLVVPPPTPDAAEIPPVPEPDAGWLASPPVTEGGGSTTFSGEDFNDVTVAAVLLDDPAMRELGGSAVAGAIAFADVAQVPGVYLRFLRGLEPPEFFEITQRELDLDFARPGRTPLSIAGAGTLLQIRGTGLPARLTYWQLLVVNVEDIDVPQFASDTQAADSDIGWSGFPLLSAADLPILIGSFTSEASWVTETMTPLGSMSMSSMTTGQATQLSGKFRRVQLDRSVTWNFATPSFAAMVDETCAGGFASMSTELLAHPVTASRGRVFRGVPLRRFATDLGGGEQSFTRSHGNPFAWSEVVDAVLTVTCRYQLPLTAYNGVQAKQTSTFLRTAGTVDVTPLVTPPRALTLGGTAIAADVTLPLPAEGGLRLTWETPRIGSPSWYVVELLGLDNDNGVTRIAPRARFTTSAMGVTIPRNLLQRTKSYALAVRAIVDGAGAPRERSFPRGEAAAYSRIVTIAE